MRINRLQLTDLRRYRDLDVSFATGLTVVRGPNEAGKTTIQRALELALTRRATSAAADIEALRPWDSGDGARSAITLTFEQEDEEVTKSGTVHKVFLGAKGTVRLDYDGQSITDPTLADQVLAELSGIPSEAFFRSTASVRHHELSDLARDESALRDRLQASISGADRGTSRARKALDKALYDLNTKGEKNPGRLKVAESAVAQAAAAVEKGELALAQLERDRDSSAAARERRAETDAVLRERRALLEKARQAERFSAERDAAQERFERFRQAVQVRDELTKLAGEHPSPTPLAVLRPGVERLRALDGRVRELRAMLAGEIEVHFDVAAPTATSWRPLAIGGGAAVLGGVAVAAATQLGMVNLENGLLIGLGSAILGAVLALIGRGQRKTAQSFARHQQLRDIEIDRRLRGRSEIEDELVQAEYDTKQQLESSGLPDLATAEDLLTREEAHVASVDRLTAQLEGLVGKEPSETLAASRDQAALTVEQKTSALEALGPIAKEPRARERLEVEVRDAEASVERARDDEATARARVEANTVDAEEVAGHAERLEGWREQLATLERRGRVYATTREAIERAEQATMKTATRFLERRMVTDLSRATGGRYRRVRVDDKTLDIAVFAPERGDFVDISLLSQGTIDLVYLAARIGLVRLVTGDRRPPLILDDPFVTLDEERATRTLAVLRELASDFQVIYLTTSNRYDSVADAIVELPGPTALDDDAPEESEPATQVAAAG